MKYQSVLPFDGTGLVSTMFTEDDGECFSFFDPASLESFRRAAAAFGLTPSDMIRVKQTHSSRVRVVSDADRGEGVVRGETLAGFDGMITNVPGIMLCTVEADCVPVYLLDPVRKAIGMVHSGWAGTAAQISADAVRRMKEAYHSDPADIMAALGPHICADCYEVGPELEEHFSPNYSERELSEIFTKHPGTPGKYLLNLSRAVTLTLLRCGLQKAHITDTGFCTFHDTRFCSWRRQKDSTKRILTAIALK